MVSRDRDERLRALSRVKLDRCRLLVEMRENERLARLLCPEGHGIQITAYCATCGSEYGGVRVVPQEAHGG